MLLDDGNGSGTAKEGPRIVRRTLGDSLSECFEQLLTCRPQRLAFQTGRTQHDPRQLVNGPWLRSATFRRLLPDWCWSKRCQPLVDFSFEFVRVGTFLCNPRQQQQEIG